MICSANMKCFFCSSDEFLLPKGELELCSGDLVQCSMCGRSNDYESLKNTCVIRIKEDMSQEITNMIAADFKKHFVDKPGSTDFCPRLIFLAT